MIVPSRSVIARYKNLVFSCFYAGRLNVWHLQFLNFFEKSNKDFFQIYSSEFPDYQLQIHNHKTKPLDKDIKIEILNLINDQTFKKNIREYNLEKLL